MSLNPLSFGLSHILNLIANLNKKNFEIISQELSQLVVTHGLEADRQLLRCLLEETARLQQESGRSGPVSGVHATLLAQQPNLLLNHPARISVLCHAIDRPTPSIQKVLKSGNSLFPQLARYFKLSSAQEVAFCLALRNSCNPDIVTVAQQHLRKKFLEVVQCYLDTDSGRQVEFGGLQDCSPEVLQVLLGSLSHESFGLAAVTKELFLERLKSDFPRELVPVVLAPLLYPDDTETPLDEMSSVDEMSGAMMDNSSLADLVREVGYSFTSSVEECKNVIMNLSGREPTPPEVARVISMMIIYHIGPPEVQQTLQTPGNFWISRDGKKDSHSQAESWNTDIFVQGLNECAPNLNWKEVIKHLDHPEFILKDRQGLVLLFAILRLGLQSAGYPSNIFPMEYIYRHWHNIEGQLSLVSKILKYPDVFDFADHPYHPVAIDILKTPPESDNKDIATWRSLYLIELLIYIWERGYPQAHELLKYPLQKCPDVFLLALLQINSSLTMVVQDLLTNLIPIFLGNHPNSAVILHQAWHSQNPNIKSIIMHAMADWYLRGENDQTRLSRILDVAQDLKALSLLLNVQSFLFVIDLACLASRREYLKLDKWLTDKIREHGESFVSAMVKFLQRRCPQVIAGKVTEEQLPKAAQLPHETIATMMSCLHICINSVQPELSDAIVAVCQNCNFILNKQRQTVPGISRPHRVIETPFNPAGLGGQIFNPPPVDPIANLGPNFANINLGAPANTAFSLPGALGPLVSTPGSPSRLIGPVTSNSPFPMMPIHGANIANMGAIPRMGPIPTGPIDKARIQDNQVIFPDMTLTVSKEIEDEANGYFQRIYNHPPHPTLSIDEVLDMLKKFQDSSNKREREVFSCMLRNLFEEYRFFPQYPDKELHITAQLFGGIIERGLVTSYVALGLALRFVLDGLRKPEGSKMYYFGIAALDRFKSKLKEYHKYCEHVRAIPHFNEFPPHLIEYVEYGLQSQEPPTKPQGTVLPASLGGILTPSVIAPTVVAPYRATVTVVATTIILGKTSSSISGSIGSRPSIANATNIDTLLVATDREEKITAPPEGVQEKIAFIFNNLSQLNLQIKCDEIRDIIKEEYWPWLSQYLVMKRASIELNFHCLYSNFLDGLKITDINKMVLKETYRNIKVLLRSDKEIANFSDRSLLKNLGHWLGMLTLGRNKPILQIDLDVKALLLEAYHKGHHELLYVVPFVAKVLESCAKSKVFRPPNPWTMAIMNVLAELHLEADLKLNLKFEIEVLCKNLNIDVTGLKPVVYLKDLEKLRHLEYQLSHPNKTEVIPIPISQPLPMPNQPVMLPPTVGMVPEELVVPSGTPTAALVPADPSMMVPLVNLTEPRFSYMDVNVSSFLAFGQNLSINPHIILFQTHPQLKQFIKPTIERSIQEWIHPVVDRSVKYALPTCEQIIRKDFALDPEEIRMRSSAHHIIKNLTAGMAMITCKEQLMNTMSTNLKTAFNNALIPATPQQKEIVESAATIVASDNMELACNFIQKTAVEKALPELDKRLVNDYELRKQAKLEGRRYYDPIAYTYQAERMPERLKLKVGGINDLQIIVYEEFARKIPGFLPIKERDAGIFIPKPVVSHDMHLAYNPVFNINQMMYGTEELNRIINDAEQFLRNSIGIASLALQLSNMHSLLEYLVIVRRNRDIMSACTLLQKSVEGLLEGLTLSGGTSNEHVEAIARYRDIHIRALKFLQDNRIYGHPWTTKQVTRCVTECREELKYNFEAIDCLIRAQLMNNPQYDLALVQMMDNGNNYVAVAFAMQLIRYYLVDERANMFVNETDFYNTIETLIRITSQPRQPPPEGLASLIEILRLNQDPSNIFSDITLIGPAVHIHAGIFQAKVRDYDDPPQMAEKTDFLIREWITLVYNPPPQSDISKSFSMFLLQMNHHGILKNDDMISRFFRIATEMCIENVCCILNEDKLNPPPIPSLRSKCYHMPDAVAKLVALLVKNSDSNNVSKINLLNKFLGIVTGCLLQDHEERGMSFEPLVYQRIFITLFLDLNLPLAALESINLQITTAFCHTLHILRPNLVPGFCFTWMDLIGHRNFIGRVLAQTPQQKGWGMYSLLLIDLFKFMAPFLRNTQLAKPIATFYMGTLRLLLVMLHDFPEILCDYHHGFCDEIPPNCIQMRNLILSAFPRNMRLPDPFTPNLKVDLLPEIGHAPRVLINYAATIQPPSFKKDLDSYLKARAPVTFLSELRGVMQISNEPGRKYNTQLMNAVVLYVGTQAIAYIRGKGQTPNMTTIAHSAHMDILQNLTVDLDHEGRYLFVNAMVNQLRYPNSHTHYFSCALLYLFAEANSEAIQEQITRALLERLIVSRPHPWGLLITFIELIKNPVYKFWEHEFVHCAPEIEKLIESVARSCFVEKSVTLNVQEHDLTD